ncbi:hypothetical protein [Desulfosoma caldarium]|uniref:Uncharacterized protein n=1 Tax=Desulfosoma caldarium TaxID=610254 RepID=A0A3N1UQ73_9BACT|nr:hypothetical protein [Desulfosoma caldarium]ROQ90677.1 hypothetical protein EDC27_2560 [Desulfosoma caldarium]
MITCMDCAWFELCEPQDIFETCPHFVLPEDLQHKMRHMLYEEWCRHHQDKAIKDKER